MVYTLGLCTIFLENYSQACESFSFDVTNSWLELGSRKIYPNQ